MSPNARSSPTMTPSDVAGRAARGGTWVFGARLADHGLIFVARLLVARWLGPEDLGLYGVALLVVTMVETLTEPGFNAAVVHRDEIDRRHVDVAWTASVVRGTALAAAVALSAPLVADWFSAPDATALIRGMALVVLLRGLVSPAVVLFERELGFRTIALIGLARSMVLCSVTVVLTLATGAVAAIVVASVVAQATHTVLSHRVRPLRLGFSLDRVVAHDLFSYGRWITGSSVAVFLLLYLDDVVVGAVLGATALATYQMAYQIAALPATEISLLVNRVTFSSFVKLRDDASALARAFLAAYEMVAILAVPIAALIAFEADLLVAALLGDDWSAAVLPLRVLAVWGALRALGAVTTPLLRSVGRPEVVAGFHWMMLLVTSAALWPAVDRWGLDGAAWAVLVPNAAIHWFRYPFVARAIERPTSDIYRRLAPVVAATAAAVSALVAGRWVAPVADDATDLGVLVRIGAEVGLAAGVYAGTHGVLDRLGIADSVGTARTLLRKVVSP